MNTEARTLFRWSNCEVTESVFLPPPPDFHSEISDNNSQGFVTSTQISEGSNSADLFSSPPKKKICHEKFSKQEALDLMESAADHAEAAQQMLELLAGRTFANVSGEDLFDMEKVQDKLRRKLDRLTKEVKTRKFKHHKLKDPEILEVTFCRKDEYSFLDNLEKVDEMSTPEQAEPSQAQPSQPISAAPQYRKRLTELKDWKRVMSRTKQSYEAVQQEAIEQGVTVTQLLALHSYRANYNSNRRLALLQKQIYEEQDTKPKSKMTVEMALHVVERFKLGKGRYRELKILLSQFLSLPDYSVVSSLRRSFCPDILPYLDDNEEIIGVCAKVSDCLRSHCLRMIQAGDLELEDVDCSLTMNVTVGIDGRGDEKEYQQRSQVFE